MRSLHLGVWSSILIGLHGKSRAHDDVIFYCGGTIKNDAIKNDVIMRSWGSRSNMDYIRTLILATSLGCVPWTTDGVCTCSRNVSEMIPCLTLVSETVKLYECSSIIPASVFDHWRRGRCMQNLHEVNVTSSQAYQATAKVQWRTEAGDKAA